MIPPFVVSSCADIIDGTDGPLKSLPVSESTSIKCWNRLLGGDGILICKGIDDVLQPCDTNTSCSLETDALKGRVSGILSCRVGDLKAWLERVSCRYSEDGCIEKPEVWKWVLTGAPFERFQPGHLL